MSPVTFNHILRVSSSNINAVKIKSVLHVSVYLAPFTSGIIHTHAITVYPRAHFCYTYHIPRVHFYTLNRLALLQHKPDLENHSGGTAENQNSPDSPPLGFTRQRKQPIYQIYRFSSFPNSALGARKMETLDLTGEKRGKKKNEGRTREISNAVTNALHCEHRFCEYCLGRVSDLVGSHSTGLVS